MSIGVRRNRSHSVKKFLRDIFNISKNLSCCKASSYLLLVLIIIFVNDCDALLKHCPLKNSFNFNSPQNQRFSSRRFPVKCVVNTPNLEDFNLPRSVAVISNEKSSGKIFLIGCLHGAPSSREDVENVIKNTDPGSVVLELCDSRYKSLSKEMKQEDDDEVPTEISYFIDRWTKGVVVTFQKKGLIEAAIGGFLSSAYLAQKLSKFDPGSEFKQVVRMKNQNGYEVINGDQDVYKTLGSFGGGLKLDSIRNITLDSVREDLSMMGQALFGTQGQSWPESLNVFQVMFLQPRLVKDLVVLLAPITFIVYAVTDGTGFLIEEALKMQGDEVVASAASSWFEAVTEAANYVTLVFVVIFTLKFFRLIIGERNEYLANSIFEVYEKNPDKNVVAVLGLLHCNGIAELLREKLVDTKEEIME